MTCCEKWLVQKIAEGKTSHELRRKVKVMIFKKKKKRKVVRMPYDIRL